MNVSYRWLQACTSEPIGTLEEIAERLAARGFPVEETRDLSAGLHEVVVAQVHEVRQHPDADRLRVCQVDGGAGLVQVVCGAPNVEAGGCYPFAPVGASLPGGMRVRKVKLRGQASEGMLCSERELGLGTDEEGLMALEGASKPGQALVEALGLEDVRLDVEVTPNRPDLLSHFGVVRELAPGGHAHLALPDIPGGDPSVGETLDTIELVVDRREVAGGGVTIRVEAEDLCLRYLGLQLSSVSVRPSPRWLQTRLRAIGARPINNVVDATNYVLHEVGQPLHAFDLDLIQDRTVVIRCAREGESIRTLDRLARRLSSRMLAICDVEKPVAVAGVIGGADSEVSDKTTEILLECALFKPASIRSTRQALGLSTEASYRFERGVDPEGMRRAIGRAAELILATGGGSISGPLLDVCPRPFSRERVPLRLERVEKVLGVPFEAEAVRALLEPLGLLVEDGGTGLSVEVPGFRSYDVTREVDLIEEVARTHGYDAFPDTLGPFRPGSVPDHPLYRLEEAVRRELVASGLLEAQIPAFASERDGEVEILNPVSAEEAFLRSRLLPGLEARLEYNLKRGNRDVRLFELGTIFRHGEAGGLPHEETHVAAILHGQRGPAHWSGPAAPLDLWDLKRLLERLVKVVSEGSWAVRPALGGEEIWGALEPEAAFRVVDAEGVLRGAGGKLRDEEVDLPVWALQVWALELTLPEEPDPHVPQVFRSLSVHPAMDRDLSLLVPGDAPVEEVISLIRQRGGEELREVEVFDVYRGDELPQGVRSVAVRLRFRALDRTLKDQEVEEAVRAVTRALEEELSVGYRRRDD